MPQVVNQGHFSSTDTESLQAGIDIFADIQTLPVEESRDVWVAINISPTLPKVSRDSDESFPLDIVVVIDTASMTSHRLLDGLKTALENIYHHLLHPDDRLAVLVTQEPKDSWSKSKKSPHYSNFLGTPKPSTIKNALTRLKTPAAQRSFDKIGENLSSAIEAALSLLKSRSNDRPKVSTSFSHVIVITSNAHKVTNKDLENEPIHLLDLGILQRPHHRTRFTSGWSLASSCLLSDHYGYHNNLDALDTFFMVARRNSKLARIENMIMDVKPAPGYPIRGTLGRFEHRVVVPGEKIIIMVRVKVPTWDDPDVLETDLESEQLIHDMEAMLDDAVSDLFTLKLSYLQRGPSSLKKFSRSIVFYLNRTNSDTVFPAPSPEHPEPSFPLHPEQQFSKLHKHLAACVASNLRPLQAIRMLQEMLNKHSYDEEVLLKIQALIGELQSHAPSGSDRASLSSQERWLLDSPASQKRPSTALGAAGRSSEHSSTPESSRTVIRGHKRLPDVPDASEDTVSSLNTSDRGSLLGPRPMSAPGKRPSTSAHHRRASSDKAQEIWRQMRSNARPAEYAGADESDSDV